MEEVPVVIVGAGPSGLAMGLSLAKYKIKVCCTEPQFVTRLTRTPVCDPGEGD